MTAKPVVVIDARMVGPVPHGISRYVSALASGLWKMRSQLQYEPVFLTGESENFRGFRTIHAASSFLSLKELAEIPSLLAKNGASIYHSPSFSSLLTFGFLRCPRPPCPWIVTIHDLIHLRYGSAFHRAYYRALLKPFAEKAAQIVTVSEFSRREIAAWTGREESSIEIAYNAMDPDLLSAPSAESARSTLRQFNLEKGRYFFCLSNPKPHKNISFLLAGYRVYRGTRPDVWPLLLSVSGFEASEGVLQVGGLNDEQVRVLRANAGAVVFPSLEEGFGLPPVETAIAGVPVIASRIPPHEEGLQDISGMVSWINPFDEKTLIKALESVQSGEVHPAPLEARKKILARFSEEALAAKMNAIYATVLKG